MITTTHRKLIEAQKSLQRLYEKEWAYEQRVRLAEQAAAINSLITAFNSFRDGVFRQFATRDASGQGDLLLRDETAATEYNKIIDEFVDRPIAIPGEPLNIETLRSMSMTVLDHIALERACLLLGV